MKNLLYDLKNQKNNLIIFNDTTVFNYTFESELYSDLNNLNFSCKKELIEYELRQNNKFCYTVISANDLLSYLLEDNIRDMYYSKINLDNFIDNMEL